MPKSFNDRFAKNYLVSIRQAETIAQYYFPRFTKCTIIEHIVKNNLFSEALDSIAIVEVAPGTVEVAPDTNGVVFLGALKEFQPVED